jgi:uncharacterized DUF497 family protein
MASGIARRAYAARNPSTGSTRMGDRGGMHAIDAAGELVAFTERAPTVRIISARRATRRERQSHEQNVKKARQKPSCGRASGAAV